MVEEISEHPLIKGKNTALSHRAATICYYTQGFCYWAKRDWRTSYEKFAKVKQILDHNPLIKADLPKRYVRTVHYLIQCQIELGLFQEARDNVKLLRELPSTDGFGGIDINVQVFNASYLSELKLYDRTGEQVKGLELVTPILAGMEELGTRLQKEYELEFYYQLACLHFGAGEVNRSLFWLNKVLNDPEPALRQDIFIYARLFNLLVHYELGNYDLLEYIVRSTQRFLSKRQKAHRVETLMMEHIKKLARANSPNVKRELYRSLLDQLVELMNDPNESTVLKYFDLLAWATSKVEGITFSEAIRARLNKK